MRNTRSLKSRFLRLLLWPLALAMLITGIASYRNAYHEAEEIYDAQLAHIARTLALLMEQQQPGDAPLTIAQKKLYHPYEKHFAYRVWHGDVLLLQSRTAVPFGPKIHKIGFSNQLVNNESWRFFVLKNPEGLIVETAEEYRIREELITHILAGVFVPMLLIAPLLVVVVVWGVGRGAESLRRLSSVVGRRGPDYLQAVDVSEFPTEIAPLAEAINRLMAGLEGALEKERQFTDHAAHELRTPLATLKTQLQVALRAQDLQERQELLLALEGGIDRATHLVEQLLTFTRIQNHAMTLQSLQLAPIVQECLQRIAPSALARQHEISAELDEHMAIEGNADMLQILLRNLLDNAIKYTPPGGRIHVSLAEQEGTAILEVADTGPGIPTEEHQKIFERFYRRHGQETEGSGLGLAMVRWIADMHHADITVREAAEGHGTVIRLTFQRLTNPQEQPE